MHPALSVIFFTVVSGTGYGLLFLLALALAIDPFVLDPITLLIGICTGAVFCAAGLTSSMLHLGQPQRAWRAFSQWRSSWLSREGVAAMICFVPTLALGALVWHDATPLALQSLSPRHALALRILGILLAAGATVTVFCTARIYTSLKTIHAWHNGYVLPGYLLLGLLGGAVWLWMIAVLAGDESSASARHVLPLVVAISGAIAYALKRAYWLFIDSTEPASSAQSATGLGRDGNVGSLEAPHTEENYLTREMGFVVARKHASRLRVIANLAFAAIPIVFCLIVFALASAPILAAICSVGATLAASAGIFVERWLFFAQARHVVMLYYGR